MASVIQYHYTRQSHLQPVAVILSFLTWRRPFQVYVLNKRVLIVSCFVHQFGLHASCYESWN